MPDVRLPTAANGQQILALLDRWRKGGSTPNDLTVDCSEVLELSADAMATLVRALSDLKKDGIKVRRLNPPQLVGHNCYRAGLLEGATAVELIGMRQEEGTAS